MRTTARSRALFTCFLLAGVFTLLSFRLVHLQVVKADDYAAEAAEKHSGKQIIYARRGVITDVNGEPLAQNEPVKTVVADASLIRDRDAFAAAIAGPLDLPIEAVREKLAKPKSNGLPGPNCYIVIKREVPEPVAVQLAQITMQAKEKKVVAAPDALRFEQDFVRTYPNGPLLCHVLGFMNTEHAGIEGVERAMNQYLAGNNGFRYIERDRTGREIVAYRGQEREARNGMNVVLTIDMGLQNIVEQEVEAAVKAYRPKSATVVLMNPQTGGVLAMATWPNFDLNKQAEAPMANRRNRAITDVVEPGSIFKIVTTAAALNERLVTPQTTIFCENGRWNAYDLKDHHGYGSLTVHDGLVKSSNIMMAKLGIQLGEQKFYEYVRKFGFGDPTGIALPGEVRGLLRPPHRWSKISITRMPMGQEVAATPLQVTAAMCAIANGGRLMLPQIVDRIVDSDGTVVAQFPAQEIRRVASQQATADVRAMLIEVVGKKGTAQLAAVPGFTVAGKTGTAQKAENGRYKEGAYVVSFLGYLPAENPAFVGLVMIDEAQKKESENYGGLVSAPVFAKIAERAARHLRLQPAFTEVPAALTTSAGTVKSRLR
jgi:cell division protein FtsI (penicillin-binding protein 3)/stage V sporulation protein D (sporulation-specific penicillin-binding protein)